MSEALLQEVVSPADAEAAAREKEAQAIRGLATAYSKLRDEIGKVIVGQREVVDQLLISLFSGGHCHCTCLGGLVPGRE